MKRWFVDLEYCALNMFRFYWKPKGGNFYMAIIRFGIIGAGNIAPFSYWSPSGLRRGSCRVADNVEEKAKKLAGTYKIEAFRRL